MDPEGLKMANNFRKIEDYKQKDYERLMNDAF